MARIPKVVGRKIPANEGLSVFAQAVVKAVPAPAWKDGWGVRRQRLALRAKMRSGMDDRLQRAWDEQGEVA